MSVGCGFVLDVIMEIWMFLSMGEPFCFIPIPYKFAQYHVRV